MTLAEFRRLADAHKLTGRTREALQLLYVDGLTGSQASRKVGIDRAAVSRARKRLERPLCPSCGRPE